MSKAASCEASQPTEVEFSELNAIVKRAKALGLSDEDCDMLSRIIETLAKLTLELEVKGTTIRRLRQLIFGSGSEKIKVVLKGKSDGDDEDKSGDDKDKSSDDEDKSGDVKDKSSDDEGEQQQGESDDADQGAPRKDKEKKDKGHGRNSAEAFWGGITITVPIEGLHHKDPYPSASRARSTGKSHAAAFESWGRRR